MKHKPKNNQANRAQSLTKKETKKSTAFQSFSDAYANSQVFRFFIFLISVNLVLTLLHVFYADSDLLTRKLLFHLDEEKNIPSLYSTLMLAVAGFAALDNMSLDPDINTISRKKYRFAWGFAGIALLFMSLDEYFVIHESADHLLTKLKEIFPVLMEKSNLEWGLKWSFALTSMVIVACVAIPCLIFFKKILNRKLFYLTMCAGALYISGAVFWETVQHLVSYKVNDLNILLLVEEISEMSGVSLILFVFLSYQAQTVKESEA